jgi:hypothetical protein
MTKGKADVAAATEGEAGEGEGYSRQPVGAKYPTLVSRDLMKNFLGKTTPREEGRNGQPLHSLIRPRREPPRGKMRATMSSWWILMTHIQKTQLRSHGKQS